MHPPIGYGGRMVVSALPVGTILDVFQQLRALRAPVSRTAYEEFARGCGWRTASESELSLVAEGPWTAGGRVHVDLVGDHVRSVAVGISTTLDRNDAARAETDAVYSAAVATGETLLGPPTGRLAGEEPHTWWSLIDATIDVCRWQFAAALTWYAPAHHAEMLAWLTT